MAQRRKALEEIEYFTGALVAQLKLLQAIVRAFPRKRRQIHAIFEAQAAFIIEDLIERGPEAFSFGFVETAKLIDDFLKGESVPPEMRH